MTPLCPDCGSGNTAQVSEYRASVESHSGLLGCRHLCRCSDCGLGFADPMPSLPDLQRFYARVYRKGLFNPYRWSSAKWTANTPWSDSQLAFIEQSVDLNGVSSAADIGCGYGHLLRALMARRAGLKTFAYEEDLGSAGYLADLGVTLNPASTPHVDLCVSSHTLEHYSAAAPFFEQVSAMSPRFLFLEVPNVDGFSAAFMERPYDSPHLLFFSLDSLRAVAEAHGWTPLRLETAGWSITDTVKQMRQHQARLQARPSAATVIRGLRQFAGGQLRRFGGRPARTNPQGLEKEWFNYGGSRWSLRGVFVPRGDSRV